MAGLTTALATFRRNRYQGFVDDGPIHAGYNVYLSGAGMVILCISQGAAGRACVALNGCADAPAQRAELARIRSAL